MEDQRPQGVQNKDSIKKGQSENGWSENDLERKNGWSENGGGKTAREITVERFKLPAVIQEN